MTAKKKAAIKKQQAAVKKQNAKFARIIAVARQYKGRPYRHGAGGPSAFDCSGYTSFVVRKAIGRSLPHQSGSQKSRVKKISRGQARAGDLIFFSSGGRVYHVGIYAGGNKLWHASRPGTPSGLGTIFSSKVTFGRVV
jgi:cell wall-associated NlpC family hydrolase